MSTPQQAEGPTADIVTVLGVPRQNSLTPEQIRGAQCVWCREPLTAAAPSLGRRQGSFMGVVGPWFPRGCEPCTEKEARRTLALHDGSCQRCARPMPAYCPDRQGLARLAGESQ